MQKRFFTQIIGGGGMIPFGQGVATPMILTSPHFQKSKKKITNFIIRNDIFKKTTPALNQKVLQPLLC